jgi:type VI secretion system secreted protein Hcp
MQGRAITAVLALAVCLVAIEAAAQQPEALMTIAGMPGQITIRVDQTDWSQIQGMPDPRTSLAAGTSRLLSSRPGSPLTSRGGASDARNSGRAEYEDFSITKDVDKATPKLMLDCATGEVIPKVTLEVIPARRDKRESLVIEMTNVVIASVAPQSTTGTNRPTESVTFSFEELKWEYRAVGGVRGATPPAYSFTPSRP